MKEITGLTLYTFFPTSFIHAELRPAIQLDLQTDGVVQINALDAAYDPLARDLLTDGVWSQPLMKVVKTTDGVPFLMSVADMLANSSYWKAEYT